MAKKAGAAAGQPQLQQAMKDMQAAVASLKASPAPPPMQLQADPEPAPQPPPATAPQPAATTPAAEDIPDDQKPLTEEDFRKSLRAVKKLVDAVTAGGGAIGFPKGWNPKQVQDFYGWLAEMHGFEPKHLLDTRTDAQIFQDVWREILTNPDALVEQRWEELASVLEKGMDFADSVCTQLIAEGVLTAQEAHAKGKALRSLLTRVRKLQQRAKYPLPPGKKAKTEEDWGKRAAWLLRFMLWVGRSNLTHLKSKGGAAAVFKLGRHHCIIAKAIWEAEERIWIDRTGVIPEGYPYRGVIIIAPPGHGKSELHAHWIARRVGNRPETQGIIVHHKEDEAAKLLAYVAKCLDPQDATGRRFLAMHPLTLAEKNNNSTQLRVQLDDKNKQPTLEAAGIRNAVNGSNADFLSLDDPVDQKERDQEAERNRTFDRINGTLLPRLRGGNDGDNFQFSTATLWHHHDAMSRRILSAKDTQQRVVILGCGGPNSPTPFEPLWPEMYPTNYLRQTYKAMQNPGLYAAAYMSQPIADEQRIVQRIRLYDPNTPEHGRFVATAIRRVSVDPAASNREHADRAGLLYLAEGFYHWSEERPEDNIDGTPRHVHLSEMRVRILDAYQIHATQTEVVEWLHNYGAQHPIDYIHVETKTGFAGLAEMFENRFKIDVVRHDPGNKSKELRLRGAAPAIEDRLAAQGIRAVVEFPGMLNDEGQLVEDPRFRWLLDEVLNFGVCSHDHGLDALTQVINWLAPRLGIGSGGIASQQMAAASDPNDGRPERFRDDLIHVGTLPEVPVEVEDLEWMAALSS